MYEGPENVWDSDYKNRSATPLEIKMSELCFMVYINSASFGICSYHLL